MHDNDTVNDKDTFTGKTRFDGKTCDEKILIKCDRGHIINMYPHSLFAGYRCKKCKKSQGERKILDYLHKNNLNYVEEYSFPGCKSKNLLYFDFYVENTFLIEFDGLQHFKEIQYFGGITTLISGQTNDRIKMKYCKSHNIPILRISFNNINHIADIIDNYRNDLQTNPTLIRFSEPELYTYLDIDD